eukprot:2363268-Amphidinium_carterae.1
MSVLCAEACSHKELVLRYVPHSIKARKGCYASVFRYHITSVDEPLSPPSGQAEALATFAQDVFCITKHYVFFFNEQPCAPTG